MRPRPKSRLSRSLFQALLSAYREARRSRSARQPSRGELYQALLDAAILTDDREAMAWFDQADPPDEPSGNPVPIRAILRRLAAQVADRGGDQVDLVDLARVVTSQRTRPSRAKRPVTPPVNPNLPVRWDDGRLLPARVPSPPDPGRAAVAFHCPECCPTPRSQQARASHKPRSAQEEAEAFLASVGGELTDHARAKELNPAHGRGPILDRILEAMLMLHRPNPILVGPSGVGKSAILEGVASRLIEGNVPGRLQGTRLFRLDANLFRAQAGIIGRIEEFLEKLVHASETLAPVWIVIDEVHLLSGTGAHKDDPKGAEQYIREHLARGRLRILGTTTPGEYQRFLAEDRGLESRIVKIDVEEPSLPVARRMVRLSARRMEDHYQARIDPILADTATSLVMQFPTGKALPLSAIELLDSALARAEARSRPPERGDLEFAIAGMLGCEVEHIRQEGSRRMRSLETSLRAAIKGQDRAIDEAVGALAPYSAGLKDRDRPAAVLLFCGPTGVGKTETARQIAAHLFGSERRLIRVAMADLTDAWAATRLLGSGPGYVGHEKGGWLIRRIRETPSAVLLLDEFDRAHPAVRDLFLEAFDAARMVDSRGLEADLRHCIVILTSNLGATGTRTPGFQEDELQSERERLVRVMKAGLSDALVGRLNAIVAFDPLTKAAMGEILDQKLRRLESRLGLTSGRVVLAPDLRERILARGYAPATGARGLDEALERMVVRPLARRILEEGLPDDGEMVRLSTAVDEDLG